MVTQEPPNSFSFFISPGDSMHTCPGQAVVSPSVALAWNKTLKFMLPLAFVSRYGEDTAGEPPAASGDALFPDLFFLLGVFFIQSNNCTIQY